jgi:hypothetical protein
LMTKINIRNLLEWNFALILPFCGIFLSFLSLVSGRHKSIFLFSMLLSTFYAYMVPSWDVVNGIVLIRDITLNEDNLYYLLASKLRHGLYVDYIYIHYLYTVLYSFLIAFVFNSALKKNLEKNGSIYYLILLFSVFSLLDFRLVSDLNRMALSIAIILTYINGTLRRFNFILLPVAIFIHAISVPLIILWFFCKIDFNYKIVRLVASSFLVLFFLFNFRIDPLFEYLIFLNSEIKNYFTNSSAYSDYFVYMFVKSSKLIGLIGFSSYLLMILPRIESNYYRGLARLYIGIAMLILLFISSELLFERFYLLSLFIGVFILSKLRINVLVLFALSSIHFGLAFFSTAGSFYILNIRGYSNFTDLEYSSNVLLNFLILPFPFLMDFETYGYADTMFLY